mgnify:CR=1 FL=1
MSEDLDFLKEIIDEFLVDAAALSGAIDAGLAALEREPKTLAGVEAKHIASGGIGGSQGSVVIAVQGPDDAVKKAIAVAESVKGEPAVEALMGECDDCPYETCAYHGLAEGERPDWLRKNGKVK